jgi:hypothetical protein
VALTIVACAPGCRQLLGITDPTPSDRIDGGGDGPPVDSSPPCVIAAVFQPEQSFAIGGTGTALAIGQLDRPGTGRDVAIAVGDGIQILVGNGAGSFSPGPKLAAPPSAQLDGLVIETFDNDADDDIVAWDEGGTTIVAYRQDAGMPSTYGAAQPLPGPFTSLQGAMAGILDGAFIPDLVVKDASGAWAYTSRLGTPISFGREPDPIGDIGPGDVLVAVGDLNGPGAEDAAFVSPSGEVKIAFDALPFSRATVVATGARDRLVGFGRLDEDGSLDLIVGTAAGGVIYRGGGGSFAEVTDRLPAVTGTRVQVIDVNGDGKDDLVLDTRIVYQCAPATPGGPGVFTQFEEIDARGPSLMADVTGDGKPDLLRLDGGELKVRVQP